jgi:hypothetical protein
MRSVNGFGTHVYGKREVNPQDGSYIVTKWIIAVFFPIVPLGSYRVIKEKQSFWTGVWPTYHMTPVALNIPQVIYTYVIWWGTLVVVLIGIYFLLSSVG